MNKQNKRVREDAVPNEVSEPPAKIRQSACGTVPTSTKLSLPSIYLDYNATTPLDPDVLESISTALRDAWGNPSSSHIAGVEARMIINRSRKNVAKMIGAEAEDIVFTSGGTEANNMVLQTGLKYFEKTFKPMQLHKSNMPVAHFVSSNLEHDSIKLVLEQFEREALAEVTFVPACKKSGRVEADDVVAAVKSNTCMITIMTANNETGVIQPIKEIFSKIRELKRDPDTETERILLHTDAAQVLGKIQVDIDDLDTDYLTIVGHKFYGPRIGALYVRSLGHGCPLYPMFYGGGQERNWRPGTENTGMIAGLGKAAELVLAHLDKYCEHMREVRDYFEEGLKRCFGEDGVHINGKFSGKSERIPNTSNISLLVHTGTGRDVLNNMNCTQASVGAACHSDSVQQVSHILLASGIPENIAKSAMRFSVGRETTKTDIDKVIQDLDQAVEKLLDPAMQNS